jgi:F420-0:gamma-glutamyl ligase-like protein
MIGIKTIREEIVRSKVIIIIILVSILLPASGAMASDVLQTLVKVAHQKAQKAANDIEAIAEKQRENLEAKKKIREVMEMFDELSADIKITTEVLRTIERVIAIRQAEYAQAVSESTKESAADIDCKRVHECLSKSD